MADKLDPSDLLKAAFSGADALNKVLELTNVTKASKAARLNVTDKDGKTALHLAVDKNHIRAIQILVEAEADINFIKGDSGYYGCEMPPLVYAVYQDKTGFVRELLKLGADINLPGNGKTALMYAAENHRVNILKMLLEAGADVKTSDLDGWTALHRAADFFIESDYVTECMKILLDYGADWSAETLNGETPLMIMQYSYIKMYHHLKLQPIYRCVKNLLNSGIDVIKCSLKNQTVLMHAVRNDIHVNFLRILMEAGAAIDLQDSYGMTALTHAASFGSTNCVRILVKAGAVIDQQDSSGMTALTHAARAGSIKCVRILVEAGAVINEQDCRGMTALTHAVRAESTSCVHWLLDSGASVNICDHTGKNPIHYLMLSSCKVDEEKHCLEMLVSKGINVNAKDNDGMTPLMYAASRVENVYASTWKSQDAMTMLLEHGAEVNALDNRGQTALIQSLISEKHRHNERNIRFLLDKGAKFSIGKLATGPISRLADLYFDYDLIELQIGNKVDMQISWMNFALVIFKGKKRFLQFLVVNGLMPPQPVPESMPSLNWSLSQSSFGLCRMIRRPLAGRSIDLDLGLTKYLIAICYLLSNNFEFFITYRHLGHYAPSNQKVNALMDALRSQPWPLVKLCFVAVSKAFGASPGRQDRVKNSQLPIKLQNMLLFQEPWSRLCVHQWDEIPLTFDPEEYENLPRPRPLLYHWPVGRALVQCDCGKCDGTMYRY